MNASASTRDIALIGCGRWGRNHVRAWNSLGRLHTACDSLTANLNSLKDAYPELKTTDSLDEILNNEHIRAVVLATPASTHGDLGQLVLTAGKHLLVEKPMALDIEQAEAMVDSAAQRGLILGVGHVLEYHPAVIKLHELIAAGDLGRVRYLYSNRLNMGTIRTEENALWSFAPHDIAIMLRIVGGFPVRISCTGAGYLNSEVADVTLMSMSFSSGVQAHIFVSWLHPFKEQRFVVVGDEKMAVFDDTAPWDSKLVLYPHRVQWKDGRVPVARKADGVRVELKESEPLLNECVAFADSIDSGSGLLTDGLSGLDVLRVLRLAQDSLEGSSQRV